MTSLVLDCPREDARVLVKSAFENTGGIKQYHDDGHRIIGKSGMGLSSYGEQVIVEIPETQTSDEETMISVSAEKEVSTNITANPEKYQSRFLQELEKLRAKNTNQIVNDMRENVKPETSKEVSSGDELRDGSSSVVIIMIMMLFISIFIFMMMAAMTP